MEDPISCQFSNGDVGLITKKVSRVELGLTDVGRNFVCKEEVMVLKTTGIELVLSIEFLRRYSISFHPSEGYLLIPYGKGNFLQVNWSR